MGSMYCAVPGCTSNSRVTPELGFFNLPRDEALLIQWTTNMGISEVMYKPLSTRAHIKVCGLHFEEKSFRLRDYKKLNRGVIPTILHQSVGNMPKEGSSKNETVSLLADPSEPGLYLSRSYLSQEEFVKKYRKLYYGKEEAKELYLQILTDIQKTILKGNIDRFKKLSNLIDYMSDIENQVTLKDFYDNISNPLRSTNLVILACKHNKVNILEHLFGNESRILNNLSIGVRRTSILPDDTDETCHNAFYYAMRSGNIGLLETLIGKWPGVVFSEKWDDILSKAYEELKLKNVPLTDEIEIIVENKLINLRFFSNTSDQNQSLRFDLNGIIKRIELILENIFLLKTNYSNTDIVDEKFVFAAKFIAQNIHILKRQLKSTYDKLPWEEIEFCLVCFVSSHTKRQEMNMFYHSTLNSRKILNHLENFAKKLEKEKDSLKVMNIAKLADLPKLKREKIVAQIISSYPQFEELYTDYQQIRDINSLQKISDYIKLALLTDAKEREGPLIITRVLQIIGEYLKNTLESPKLSTTTSELFLLSLPKKAREVIIGLRNSLSHAYSLSKRIEIEENTDVNFFINIQKDTKKLGDVINDIMYKNKIKTIRILLKKIVNSESLDEIKEITKIFSFVNFEKLISENFKMMEHETLGNLIKELCDTVIDQTNYEKELFNKINNIINCTGSHSENVRTDYITGLALAKGISIALSDHKIDYNTIRGIKFKANHTLENITPKVESHSLKEIAELSMQIFNSAMLRLQHENLDQVKRIICKIVYIVEFETGDLKWIEELREKLNEKGSFISTNKQIKTYNVTGEKYNKQLELKICELKTILSNKLLNDQSIEKFLIYKDDIKLQAAVEMLLLDIMSILGNSKHCLENNLLFLDDNSPLLIGKCLRNHLAHDNSLIDVLLSNPSLAVIINAKKFTEENIMRSKKKIGKLVNEDAFKLRKNYDQGLDIISNQKIMFVALEEGNLESLKDCLKKGTDIHARSIDLWTTLHFAAKGSSLEVIKFILEQNVSVSVKDVNSQSPLHIAAAHGRYHIVEYFVKEAGLYVDVLDNCLKTPLHIAAKNGHKDTVEVLLQNKANTEIKDAAGLSPLHYAISNNHINVVKVLLEKDANVDINETMGGFTPLHTAAEGGHLELINFLLQNKSDVNARNDFHWTALHAAAFNGHLEVVNVLILKGADVNARVLNGCSPLHYAVENGHEKIANILLKHGANVNAVDKTYNNTPLHYAAKDGYEGIVKTLLKNKANANVATTCGITPVHFAAKSGHLEIVIVLMKHGVNIDAQDKLKNTPLYYAVESGHREVAELLINHGVEINAKAINNSTPLHAAALKGHEDVIDLLIKNQARINAQDIMGQTPLHAAAINGSKDIIDLLIKNKAEVNVTAGTGLTPLHSAVVAGHIDAINLLIKNKAEVNAGVSNDLTPLHAAVSAGHTDVIKLLIKNKAEVNTMGVTGMTPLHLAVETGNEEIVQILIANGANVDVNRNNRTPLLSAIKHNHKEIVKILIENRANVNAAGDEPLSLAVLAGSKDIVEILLKNKIDVDIKVSENTELLHLAASRGNKDIVNSLISNGANVNAVILETAPLHIAAVSGNNNVVKVLLNNGAKINIKDEKNRTALELAAAYGHLEIVKTLLEYKEVNINAKGNNDWTVLHIAAQNNYLEIVKYLVDNGSDIHAKNSSGSKPIHIAAREGYKDTVEFFLSKGSNMNDLGAAKQTLLHYAAMKGQLEVVKYLMAQDADVNINDANGSTPMHIAAELGYKDVIKVLLKNGAVYNAIDKFNRKPLEIATEQNVINLLTSTEKLFEAVKRNSVSEVENSIKAGAFVNAKNTDSATPLHYAAWKGYDGIVNILIQNNANPNMAGNKGFTPLHYAVKFSHLKVVKALLSNGAVYNAVSCAGKTPSDFTVDTNIISLFKLVSESFKNIKNGNSQVINNLNKIKDIDTIKTIMSARNRENQTLVVAAMHSKFSKVEQLKQISQGDVSVQINEASRFLNQGNYQQALSIFKSVFEKRKEILGSDNPGTLDIQTYIAGALYKQGTYQEALNTFEEIYQKQKKMLGLNDTDTLSTRSTIALVLHRQGKDEDAFKIYQEVCQKQMELLGPNHWDTLNSQFHMALVLDRQGKYEEALEINRTVFEKRRETLGANNPATVSAQNNIAMVLANQGKYDEALKMYNEVYRKKKLVLGNNHSDTLRTLHNMAGILCKDKKYSEALKSHQKVFNIQKSVLGPNHPDTLLTQYNMANVLFSQGKWIAALKAYKESFDKIKAVFGPIHPMVSDILKKLESINMIFKLRGDEPSEILQYLQKDINIAASNGDTQNVQRLLKDGADANDKDIDGRTPLHFAVSNRQIDVVNILLKNGADVTQVTNKGNTALHTATSKGYKEIVDVLLQHVSHNKLNEFINAKTTGSGATPLHVASKNGSLGVIKSLLNRGAIYNIKNNEGYTPVDLSKDQNVKNLLNLVEELFRDAKNGNVEIISKLKAVKCDEFVALTNARNNQENTLLAVSIANRHKNVANKLLEILKKPD